MRTIESHAVLLCIAGYKKYLLHYKLQFTTNGKGSFYYFQYDGLPKNATVIGPSKIETFGQAVTYNFDIRTPHYMKIRVLVHDNPLPRQLKLKLVETKVFKSGSVELHYIKS
jgi:hypothetical protein